PGYDSQIQHSVVAGRIVFDFITVIDSVFQKAIDDHLPASLSTVAKYYWANYCRRRPLNWTNGLQSELDAGPSISAVPVAIAMGRISEPHIRPL
ncbi:hypothetical protein [truncated ORF], partial [Aspergillus niger]|uniref:Uncharacterized protein n=2 Tax=Aspergillus niger TaxID=5061 RepID=A0AAJ8BZV6_ASPNG